MATHSSILAWEIPGTEEPGGLQSMGSQTVRQDRARTHTHPFLASGGEENQLGAKAPGFKAQLR